MSAMESFESTLKEAVQGKRLSVSQMKEVTNIALKNMEHDTQMVSILYRTHRTLSPASKIHSLYVFDSLSRAARHQVTKQGLTSDLHSEQGNCASFLLKIEGVLDGLFQDMVSSSHPEAKEKTKKILDIWVKSNTFPSAVLARLHKLVKGTAEKDSDNTANAVAPVDPRLQSHNQTTPLQASVTPNTEGDMQATLLALLTQAASVVGVGTIKSPGQIAPNTPSVPPVPQLDKQLAILQQLTQAASAGTVLPTQPLPVPVSIVPSSAPANAVPPVAPPVGGPSQSLPYPDDHNGYTRRESQYDRYGGQERGKEFFDDRRDPRGNFRGGFRNDFRGDFRGGYRGASRARGRGRWDDHDRYSERNRAQDWDQLPLRNGRSRSRSPPYGRYGGARRDQRPPSPPQRGTPVFRMPDASSETSVQPPDADMDEFGRVIRPESPQETMSASSTKQASELSPIAPDSASVSTMDNAGSVPPDNRQAVPGPSSSTTTVSSIKSSSFNASSAGAERGLDTFDLSAFDLTSPSAWEALGKAWGVTNGYMPAQDELMQYIMSRSMGNMADQTYPVPSQYDTQRSDRWSGHEYDTRPRGHAEPWRGRGAGRGRGYRGGYQGHGYGNSRDVGGRDYEQTTDALTLAGGEDSPPPHAAFIPDHNWQELHTVSSNAGPNQFVEARQSPTPNTGNGSKAGRMQRVGDKWVFVRGEAPNPEVA